jgi:hypothetical protein
MALLDLLFGLQSPMRQTTPPFLPGGMAAPAASKPAPVLSDLRHLLTDEDRERSRQDIARQKAEHPELFRVPGLPLDEEGARLQADLQAMGAFDMAGRGTAAQAEAHGIPNQKVAAQEVGILSRLGRGALDYLSDPINRKQLAIGLNSMRLNPDPNFARLLQSQIETEQGMRLLRSQGNKTADALAAAGHKELAEIVRDNPSLAKEAISVLTRAPDIPDGFLSAHLKAVAAGHEVGSEGYRKAMGAETSYGGLSEGQIEGVSGIRKEFMGVPQVKAFQDQVAAYGRIISSAEKPSAAGDLALIFNYMKLLDPGSVVRESEFRTAEDASAWLQESEELGIVIPRPVQTAIQKLETGQLLVPKARADFVDRSARLYSQAESSYVQNYEDRYIKFLNPYLPQGADPFDYLPRIRYVGKSASDIASKTPAPKADLVFNPATGQLEPAVDA